VTTPIGNARNGKSGKMLKGEFGELVTLCESSYFPY